MVLKYNLIFVPNLDDRKKISHLRSKICKKIHSTQALQYPVHISLISSGFHIKNFTKFEQSLKELCKNEKPLKVKTEKLTTVLPDRFWTGIQIIRTNDITELQKKLQRLRNVFSLKKENHQFHPLHITLAFPAKVDELKPEKCPIKNMILDRITIVKKEKESDPYRIFKHIKLG